MLTKDENNDIHKFLPNNSVTPCDSHEDDRLFCLFDASDPSKDPPQSLFKAAHQSSKAQLYLKTAGRVYYTDIGLPDPIVDIVGKIRDLQPEWFRAYMDGYHMTKLENSCIGNKVDGVFTYTGYWYPPMRKHVVRANTTAHAEAGDLVSANLYLYYVDEGASKKLNTTNNNTPVNRRTDKEILHDKTVVWRCPYNTPSNIKLFQAVHDQAAGKHISFHSQNSEATMLTDDELLSRGVTMMYAHQTEFTMIFTKRGCIHDVSTPKGVFKIARNIITDQCLLSLLAWIELYRLGVLTAEEKHKYKTLGIRNADDVDKLITYCDSMFGPRDSSLIRNSDDDRGALTASSPEESPEEDTDISMAGTDNGTGKEEK